MSIIKKINNYNNKKNIDNNKILNIKKNYSINFDKNKNRIIINDNKNKILVGEYIFFGIYQPDTQLWIWASSIPGVSQKQIKTINKLKTFNYLFENDDSADILFLYQLLSNDVVQITNTNIFPLINKTLNYLSNCVTVLTPSNKINNIQFIGISSIIEQY
jgi:hypothetical protein